MFYVNLVAKVSHISDFEDEEFVYITFSHLPDSRDICEYYFEQKFNKKFNATSWMLELGAHDYISYIEDKWLHNMIDEYKLFNEELFKSFMVEKYQSDIEWLALRELDKNPDYYYVEDLTIN